MDFNNFDYLTINRLGYIHNYIQSVVPFVYDQSLDLFALLRKLVDYANEIGKRNNDLASTFDNLVDYVNESEQKQVEFINKFVAQMRSEFEAWKTLYNQKYNEFTQEQINNYNNFVTKTEKALADFEENINTLYTNFKNDINTQEANFESNITNKQTQYETETTNQINAWKTEIDSLIADIQSTVNSISAEYNTRFNNFETQTNNSLTQYNTELNNLITEKNTEINNRITQAINDINQSISEVNLQPMVETEVKKLIKSGEMTEALENLYGSIIRITYWDTNTPPTVQADIPVYHYNPDTATLTNCVTNTVVPLLKNSIYVYNGYVYISEVEKNFKYEGTNNNNTYKLSYINKSTYIDGYLIFLPSSSGENIIIFDKDNNNVFNQIIRDNGQIAYITKYTIFNDKFYFITSNNYFYEYNFKTKTLTNLCVYTRNYGGNFLFINENEFYIISGQSCYKFTSLTDTAPTMFYITNSDILISNIVLINRTLHIVTYYYSTKSNYYVTYNLDTQEKTRTEMSNSVINTYVDSGYLHYINNKFYFTYKNGIYNITDNVEVENNEGYFFNNSINSYTENTFNYNDIQDNKIVTLWNTELEHAVSNSNVAFAPYTYLRYYASNNTYYIYKFNNIETLHEIAYQRKEAE